MTFIARRVEEDFDDHSHITACGYNANCVYIQLMILWKKRNLDSKDFESGELFKLSADKGFVLVIVQLYYAVFTFSFSNSINFKSAVSSIY